MCRLADAGGEQPRDQGDAAADSGLCRAERALLLEGERWRMLGVDRPGRGGWTTAMVVTERFVAQE